MARVGRQTGGRSCILPIGAVLISFVVLGFIAVGGLDPHWKTPTVIVPVGTTNTAAVLPSNGDTFTTASIHTVSNDPSEPTPLLSTPSDVFSGLTKPLVDRVLLAGNRPVGTYLCSYFPKAQQTPGGGCILGCEDKVLAQTIVNGKDGDGASISSHLSQSKVSFNCEIVPKASPEQLYTADIVVNHHGPVPKKVNGRPLITMFYSGESNASEGKKAKPEYQRQYDVTVSFHQFRKHFFTWTHRHKHEFDAIKQSATQRLIDGGSSHLKHLEAAIIPAWRNRIPAIAVFVSRCKKGGRDQVIRELGKHFPVHSFGKCARSHTVEKEHPSCLKVPGQGETGANRYPSKLCVFRKYQYVLALDNTRELDYVTEKVYHALLTGAVPIYDGAPNVAEFLPGEGTSSIIQLQDFSASKGGGDAGVAGAPPTTLLGNSNTNNADVDFAKLGQFLKRLSVGADAPDQSALSKLLSWHADPSSWSPEFIANIEKEEPTCGVCAEARHIKSKL